MKLIQPISPAQINPPQHAKPQPTGTHENWAARPEKTQQT